MKVRWPSASQLDRALACPASCWLPEHAGAGEQSEVAARGHRMHTAMERSYLTTRDADRYSALRPYEVNAARGAVALRPLIEPLGDFPLVEVECWYEPLTCEAQLGSTPEPKGPPPGWCRGRTDLIGLAPKGMVAVGPDGGPMDIGGKPIVVDHKSGNPRYQTPAKTSAQLGYFSSWLSVMDPVACKTGVAQAVYLTQSGKLDCVWRTMDEIRLYQERLAGLWALLHIVESGKADLADPRFGMSCKSSSSKWCTVEGCKRNVP